MKANNPLLASALVGALVPMILTWMMSSANSNARIDQGRKWMEYGRAMRAFALLMAFLVGSLVAALIFVGAEDRMPVLVMIVLFGGIGIPLCLEFFIVRIGFDGANAYCNSPWRKNRIVPLDAISERTYSHSNMWWVLKTREFGNIRLSDFLSGRKEFLAELDRRGVPIK